MYYNKFNSYSMKIGDKFNDWTVIDDKSINRNGATMYLCRCKCGKEQYVQSWERVKCVKNAVVYLVRCKCGSEHYMPASQILDPNKYFKCKRCASGNIVSGFREGFLNTLKGVLNLEGYFIQKTLLQSIYINY